MEKKSLYIYKLDEQGNKVKFPNSDMPAKLGEYTYSAQRMAGTPTLTATLNYPSCLDEEWSGEEFIEFRGEKYYVDQTPTSSKDNKSIMYKHELQFVSERIVLENVYFMDVVTAGADTYHSNSTSVKFMGDIHEFVGRLNASMTKSGIGYSVIIDDDITSDSKLVSLDNVYLADALQSIYTIYELPYYFVGKVCHIGYTEHVVSTPFEYRKGLVSIKKTNANYKIVNRVTGVGSSDNIPFYYPNDDETGTIERSQNLMPSIYRQTSGAERFYNALNNTYKIPGTNDYYSFKNTYSAKKVKEIKVDFSDIKPTIEGVTNASGQLFGEIADIAFDENDSDELGTGEGNNVFNGTDEYVHSYFYIKLHIYNGDYGFNLFEQGLEGGTAVINMTTGNCAACEFEIGVTYKDGDKRAYNPVLLGPTGNLIPGDFEQKVTSNTSQYVESQQDTSKNEVWIAVKKDNTSFGVVMPNATNNYRPSVGDKFVITGIKMPKSLVLAAEKRLEEALIKYMSENNDEKFTFSVNFSRVFLADNTYLWDILNENARIYIKYNNREYLMYVNSYTCKADKNCLYDISVELVDKLSANVSALRSTITEIAGDIIGEKIGSGGNVSTSDILAKVSRHFISKRHDDRTPYKVSSDTAFEVGEFVPGSSGAIVYKDKETGQTVGEIDKFYFRMKAYFESLEIVNVNSIGGKQIISPAGAVRLTMAYKPGDKYKIVTKNSEGKDVETEVTVPQGIYRCFFLAEQDGQEVENRYKVGDQIQSKDFNIKKPGIYNQVVNHYYWRLVTGVTVDPVVIGKLGYHYVDLSVTDCDTGSDAPAEGDVIAHLGNRNDVDRQNALVFSSVDTFSPSITLYQGINSYSYLNKDVISYGVDKTTGKAFFNVYGDMYIGDRDNNSFLKFTQEYGLELKGKLDVNSTLSSGGTLTDAFKKATEDAVNTAKEDIGKFNDAIQKEISNLQDQVDGAIETWFNDPVPTLTNYPANEWTTNDLKNIHLGDLYYSGEGKAYRFQMDGNNYVWKEITDSDITKALADAKKAQDTADGKRKVFVRQPTNDDEYDVGDLWVNATYGTTYSNDILRAVSSKAKGSPFSINHWTKSSKYTDDTKAEQVQQNVDKLSTNINNVSNTVNDMKNFTDTAFADGIVDRSEASAIANYLKVIETTQKDVMNAYSSVYNNALLDGVAKTNLNSGYTAFNTSATELINAVNSAIADGITTSIERANVDAKYTNFNTKYGDFVAYLNAANKYIQDKINKNANDALTQIGGLAYLKKALKENTSIEGGLIQSSMLALGYTPDNGAFTVMSGTNGIYDSARRGGGIASWWGGGMLDMEDYTSANMPNNVANGLVRFDGSGYLAGGNIKWDAKGKVTADPLSFFVGSETVGGLLASFQVVMNNNKPDYIIPQVPFQSLDISTSLRIGNGWLKWDATNNAVYVVGKDGEAIGFYSTGWMSAKGVSAGGSSGVASALSDLTDVSISSPSSNQVLSYNATTGKWENKTVSQGLDPTALWAELAKADATKKIDISHLPTLFTALSSTSASNLSATVGGVTKSITNVYARYLSNLYTSRPTSANVSFGDGTVRYFVATSSMTTGKPTEGDSHILHMSWDNTGGWDGQLSLPTNPAKSMSWRTQDSGTWGNWVKILDSSNYSSVLDSRYVTLATDQTITGKKSFNLAKWSLVGNESNEITNFHFLNNTWNDNETNNLSSIKNAIQFRWYESYWVIGAVRSGGAASYKFGIGKKLSDTSIKPVFAVNENYNKTLEITVTGSTGKNQGSGIWFRTTTHRSQEVILRHEWHDTFVAGYGLAISKSDALEAGDSRMFLYNTGRYISKAPTGTKPIDVVSTTLCNNLNADLLDGQHETAFLRHRTYTTVDGENTLWSQIGIKTYSGAYPDGMTLKKYSYGQVISFTSSDSRLDVYSNHHSSADSSDFVSNGIQYRTGWANDKKPWRMLLDNVNYASYVDSRYVKKAGGTMTGNLTMSGSNILISQSSATSTQFVRLQGGDNDYGRIAFGATASNAGWMEIATADDGTEPIYARQYTGLFGTVKNTLTLLDANGDTIMQSTKGLRISTNSTVRQVRTEGCWIHGGADAVSSTDANLRFGSWFGVGWYPTISGQTVAQGNNAMWLSVRSGNLDVAGRFKSNVATGTAPYQCNSTTLNTNLNADLLDGYHQSSFHIGWTGGNKYRLHLWGGNQDKTWRKIVTYVNAGSSTTTYQACTVKGTIYYVSGNHSEAQIINIPFQVVMYAFGSTAGTKLNSSTLFLPVYCAWDLIRVIRYADNSWEIQVRQPIDWKKISFEYSVDYIGGTVTAGQFATSSYSSTVVNNYNTNVSRFNSDRSKYADQLTTARTIWGQSFNGTANVTGTFDMGSGRFKMSYTDDYVKLQSYKSKPLVINTEGNNVGIGATAPLYKLHVAGDIIAAGGWVRTSGNTGWYSETHGGGWYMSDSSFVRNHNSKRLRIQTDTYDTIHLVRTSGSGGSSIAFYNAGGTFRGQFGCTAYNWFRFDTGTAEANQVVVEISPAGGIHSKAEITAKASGSDIRLKKDIRAFHAMGIIHKFRSVKYHWNDIAKANSEVYNNDDWQFGLIAQDLLAGGYKQWVRDVFHDYYTIAYERLIPVMWKGLQEVDSEVIRLRRRVEQLEKELYELKKRA